LSDLGAIGSSTVKHQDFPFGALYDIAIPVTEKRSAFLS